MSIFSKIFRRKTSDLLFERLEPCGEMTLENQDGKITGVGMAELEKYLYIMMKDADQFITFKPADTSQGISYMQACQVPSGISVQLGLQEGDKTKLVEKICSQQECKEIFRTFYETGIVYNREEYQPVEFYVPI